MARASILDLSGSAARNARWMEAFALLTAL
jgi:hypothetical protein